MSQELDRSDYYERVVSSQKLDGFALIQKQAGVFFLAETVFTKTFRLPTHSHRFHSISIVLDGSFTETKGINSRKRESFDVDLIRVDEAHAADFPDCDTRCFNLEIPTTWIESRREYSTIFDEPGKLNRNASPVVSKLMMRLYRESHNLDSLSPLVVESILLELTARASREAIDATHRRPPLWLTRASNMIRDQFSESLTLETVAKSIGVHPVYLASTFRKFYSCTVGEYLRRLRIEFVCEALAKSEISISDIAQKAGFADHSHLCKTFKKHTGFTPGEYRALVRRS